MDQPFKPQGLQLTHWGEDGEEASHLYHPPNIKNHKKPVNASQMICF